MSILPLLCVLLFLVVDCRNCPKLLPGLDKMQSGIDLSNFDMYAILTPLTDPNFLLPVIEYTCNENKTIYYAGEPWDFPDQAASMVTVPGGQLNFRTFVNEFSLDVKEQIRIEMNSESFLGFQSDSASFEAVHAFALQNDWICTSVASDISVFKVIMHPLEIRPDLIRFTEDANYMINNLPSQFNAFTVPEFEKVIGYIGTHIIVNGRFSGVFRQWAFLHKFALFTLTWAKIEGDAESSFFNFISASGGATGSIREVSAIFRQYSSTYYKCLGGSGGCPTGPDSWNKWADSVAKNPFLSGLSPRPIYDLIKNETTKNNMKLAITNHFLKVFLIKEFIPTLILAKARIQTIKPIGAWAVNPIPQCCATTNVLDFEALLNGLNGNIAIIVNESDTMIANAKAILLEPIVNASRIFEMIPLWLKVVTQVEYPLMQSNSIFVAQGQKQIPTPWHCYICGSSWFPVPPECCQGITYVAGSIINPTGLLNYP